MVAVKVAVVDETVDTPIRLLKKPLPGVSSVRTVDVDVVMLLVFRQSLMMCVNTTESTSISEIREIIHRRRGERANAVAVHFCSGFGSESSGVDVPFRTTEADAIHAEPFA